MITGKCPLLRVTILVTVLSSCGVLSNDVYFEGYGSISGRILVDGDGASDAVVFVMGKETDFSMTEIDGTFSLVGTEAGRELNLVAMWGSDFGFQHQIDLAADVNRQLGDLVLLPIGLLEGRVDIPDPQVAEVRVIGTPFVGHTDRYGRYSLMLPAGKWNLEISATGYLSSRVYEVEITSGRDHDLGETSLSIDSGYSCESVETRTDRFSQGGGGAIDILFVVDNSASMVEKQRALADSFSRFIDSLENGTVDYHIAVLTTGMESVGCPQCNDVISESCINESLENGRFQDRRGKNIGTNENPDFDFVSDASCRIVDVENLECFFDSVDRRGTVFVGVNGCIYERGLAAMRRALQNDLLNTYNQGFLRESARLAVVVISDENDCGEIGDVSENIPDASGQICFYAAKGIGPEGETSHPNDPDHRPYSLTPVYEYASFLQGLKQFPSMVSFSAIVGVSDPHDPSSTAIEYRWDTDKQVWGVAPACTTEDCSGTWCDAMPGTRYIDVAMMTGGSVESICQTDFSAIMENIVGTSTGFRRSFFLSYNPVSADDIRIKVNGETIPSGWQWRPEDNSILFEEVNTPFPYSLVVVEYVANCR